MIGNYPRTTPRPARTASSMTTPRPREAATSPTTPTAWAWAAASSLSTPARWNGNTANGRPVAGAGGIVNGGTRGHQGQHCRRQHRFRRRWPHPYHGVMIIRLTPRSRRLASRLLREPLRGGHRPRDGSCRGGRGGTGEWVIDKGSGQDRRAIAVPLTPVTKGLSRSLRDSPPRRSDVIAARMAQIPKLIVRVRFSSPLQPRCVQVSAGVPSAAVSRCLMVVDLPCY